MSIRYLALGLLVASLPVSTQASRSTAPADQAIVDCRMPPQLRSLGRNMTYMAAGRQVRIAAADCLVRGGSYDGRGPGEKAGANVNGRSAVMIGGDESRPGCPGSGRVSGMSAAGTLSVRAAPGTVAARLDKLANGANVYMCDWSADGAWVGVVYAGNSGSDCGVSSKVTPSRAYDGPCKSGWVAARYVK